MTAQSPILKSEELYALTGYRQPCKQREWLTRNGIRHYIGADGKPRTTLGLIEQNDKEQAAPEPDFAEIP